MYILDTPIIADRTSPKHVAEDDRDRGGWVLARCCQGPRGQMKTYGTTVPGRRVSAGADLLPSESGGAQSPRGEEAGNTVYLYETAWVGPTAVLIRPRVRLAYVVSSATGLGAPPVWPRAEGRWSAITDGGQAVYSRGEGGEVHSDCGKYQQIAHGIDQI